MGKLKKGVPGGLENRHQKTGRAKGKKSAPPGEGGGTEGEKKPVGGGEWFVRSPSPRSEKESEGAGGRS